MSGLFRDLINNGVSDYLVKPIAPALIQKSLLNVVESATQGKQNDRRGRLVAVTGARGGVGATMLATGISWSIANRRRRRVALVDLDLQFGTVALALDLEPSPGLREALEHPGRIDALFVERAMVRQSDTLFVLSGEESLGDPVAADTSSLDILLKELRNKFHYVVVDVPRQVSAATQYIAQSATNLVLVTDLSLAGMRDTLRQLTLLPTANAACQITIVANRVGEYREGEIARKEFEAAVGRAIDFIIPFDARSVAAATNVGRPVVDGRGKVADAIQQVTERIAGNQAATAVGQASPALAAGPAMSMFGRRSVGPAPPEAPAAGAPVEPPREAAPAPAPPSRRRRPCGPPRSRTGAREALKSTHARIQAALYDRIDATAATKLPRDELNRQILELIGEVVAEQRLSLHGREQEVLGATIVDNMVGLGPLEPLLRDETITDIMVNGCDQIYVERKGKLELTDVKFRDNQHVMNVAQRIVTRIGRRVDETSPICDARLEDGSRVNVIAPPLAIDGCSISIRKFSKKSITLDVMARQSNISEGVARLLKIASACRLNIVISGGTGSGKTTMLNAMSQLIDTGERVVTIEDAAELQLQQPHVVRLETRPANLEGQGEITMRDLVKNALRMRPDRIICGEVRGPEAMDMLQAMNTGHDGSMCTLHANSPREAVTRMENMVGMAAATLSPKAIRSQIVGAVHLLLQVSRMRDGVRRVTHVTEIVGMEGEVVTMQDLFTYEYQGEGRDGLLIGAFKPAPVRPYFIKRAAYYGLDRALLAAMQA